MKTSLLALVTSFLIGFGSPCVAGVLPDINFYVSVETNEWMERPRGKEELSVSVQFYSADHVEGARKPAIKVICHELPPDCCELGERELELFHRFCEEAGKGRAKKEWMMSKGYLGEVETVFESKEENGNWVATMTRSGKSATFDPAESGRVMAAIAEGKAGAAWFKLLRTADKLPEKTPEAHPPKSNGYYLDVTVGEVDGGEMDYEVSLNATSFDGKVDYSTRSTLTIGSGTVNGGWVDEALNIISEAAEAAKAKKNLTHESRKVGLENESSYTITANAQTGKADVALSPGTFFKSEKIWKGSFGVEEVQQIRKLQEKAITRQKWFEEHEGLFFSRPPAARK